MKTISLREFQRNASKYINDLPFEITRYGSVIAIVTDSDNSQAIKEQVKDHDKRIKALEELASNY